MLTQAISPSWPTGRRIAMHSVLFMCVPFTGAVTLGHFNKITGTTKRQSHIPRFAEATDFHADTSVSSTVPTAVIGVDWQSSSGAQLNNTAGDPHQCWAEDIGPSPGVNPSAVEVDGWDTPEGEHVAGTVDRRTYGDLLAARLWELPAALLGLGLGDWVDPDAATVAPIEYAPATGGDLGPGGIRWT